MIQLCGYLKCTCSAVRGNRKWRGWRLAVMPVGIIPFDINISIIKALCLFKVPLNITVSARRCCCVAQVPSYECAIRVHRRSFNGAFRHPDIASWISRYLIVPMLTRRRGDAREFPGVRTQGLTKETLRANHSTLALLLLLLCSSSSLV